MKVKVTRKFDGNGRELRRCRPILQDIKYFINPTRVVTITGDIWDVKKTNKGYQTI